MFVSSEIVIVFLGFIAMALSMPAESHSDNKVQVLKYHDDRNADGSYDFNYELSDGQARQEKGSFRDGKDANGNDIKVLSVTGSYKFEAPNGATFQVFYIADERGYRIVRMTANEPITPSDMGIRKDEEDIVATTLETHQLSEAEEVTTTESS